MARDLCKKVRIPYRISAGTPFFSNHFEIFLVAAGGRIIPPVIRRPHQQYRRKHGLTPARRNTIGTYLISESQLARLELHHRNPPRNPTIPSAAPISLFDDRPVSPHLSRKLDRPVYRVCPRAATSPVMPTAGLKTIIALSFVLAVGFLLVILSCALFKVYYPLLVVATYILAPVPNWVCGRCANPDDFVESSGAAVLDLGRFFTGFFVVMGIGKSPFSFGHPWGDALVESNVDVLYLYLGATAANNSQLCQLSSRIRV